MAAASKSLRMIGLHQFGFSPAANANVRRPVPEKPGRVDVNWFQFSDHMNATMKTSPALLARGSSWLNLREVSEREQSWSHDHSGEDVGLQHHQHADEAGQRDRVPEHEAQDG